MRGPLSVEIDDGTTVRHVTDQTTGLRFRRTAYGGDADISCQILAPRGMFTDLGPMDTITVYDVRNGETVWVGDIDNPGVTNAPTGQLYDLQAFGGAARLQQTTQALGYIVTDMDIWEHSSVTQKGAHLRTGEIDADTPTLEVFANDGKTVGTGWQGEWITRVYKENDLAVRSVDLAVDSGITNANYVLRLRTGTGSTTDVDTTTASTSSTRLLSSTTGGGTEIAVGDNVVALRADRSTSSIAATDDHWFRFSDITIWQQTVDINGNYYDAGTTLHAREVIADMIGRGMAPGADPAKATIETVDNYAIDVLNWLDGTTMGDALADLLVFEPNLYWMLQGDTFTSGYWDESNPRYVISKADGGITHPGKEMTLCNRILVTWTDNRGRDRSTIVTASVPELGGAPGDAGATTRDADAVTLPDGFGSDANAQQAGEQILAFVNEPSRDGTAVVTSRILDLWQGCLVLPHEIMPGCVVLEQETGDSFKLTEVEYSDDDGAATLTLGEPAWSVDQAFANLVSVPSRRRRHHKKHHHHKKSHHKKKRHHKHVQKHHQQPHHHHQSHHHHGHPPGWIQVEDGGWVPPSYFR